MISYYGSSENWWFYSVVSSTIAALLSLLYYYSTSTFDQLRKQNVPHLPPVPLFGNIFKAATFSENQRDTYRRTYRHFPDAKICGIYHMKTPYLMIRDPELIDRIFTKDFPYFTSRGYIFQPDIDILSRSLFFDDGQRWKVIRKKLHTGFTSIKLKSMRDLMAECSDRLLKCIEDKSKDTNELDMVEISTNFAIDVIGTSIYGVKLDTINNNDSEFKEHAEKLLGKISIKEAVYIMIGMFFPKVFRFFKLYLLSPKATNFFRKMFDDMMEYRTKNNVVKDDLFETLKQARQELVLERDNMTVDYDAFTDMDINANAVLLFMAGSEIVAVTAACAFRELALNRDIQDKLREEITTINAKYGGQFTKEFLVDLDYTHMFLKEVNRFHSITTFIPRVASKDYKVPGMESFTIKKGQHVLLPMECIHNDPKYYPNPETFDPERFSKEEIAKRQKGTFFPFGMGPRQCIGIRFAEFELKFILSKVLTNYELSPCENMEKNPIEIESKVGLTMPKNGIRIKFTPITNQNQ